MALSCRCDYTPQPWDILWDAPEDYSVLDTKRNRKCACCGATIHPGDLTAKFRRWKVPASDVEIAIYGDSIEQGPYRAPHYLCEGCADQYFNLTELGFCFNYTQTMEALEEYRALRTSPFKRITTLI